MREKTHAHRHYQDDVDQATKVRRLSELNHAFRTNAEAKHKRSIGTVQTVLVERPSKRDPRDWSGKAESNIRVNFPTKPQIAKGDYVRVRITGASSMTLFGDIVD